MDNKLTSGKCRLCGRMLGKRQMTNHLKACWKQHAIAAPGKATRRWFHLVVEGRYAPDYWLHLQAPAHCTFGALDSLLRAIWLECCGHLSAFEFPAIRVPRTAPRAIASIFEALAQGPVTDHHDDDQLMSETLGSKLRPTMVFSHQYDFGTTTELGLRVAGEYPAPALKGVLKLLARNEPPLIPCRVCSKPATQLCQECDYDCGAPLCDACASMHDCDPEMLVPLINSPRTGLCGYCGPSNEP